MKLRWLWVLVLGLAACRLIPIHPAHPTPHMLSDAIHTTAVMAGDSARTVLEFLSAASARSRSEQAVCISAWTWTGGKVVIERVEPADIAWADSLNVQYRGSKLCGGRCPSLHWHIVANGMYGFPSAVDLGAAVTHSDAAFQVLGTGGTADLWLYATKSTEIRQVRSFRVSSCY